MAWVQQQTSSSLAPLDSAAGWPWNAIGCCMSRDHPFDKPFNIMKGVTSEVVRLREALKQEVDTREMETAALRDDMRAAIAELKKAAAEDRKERKQQSEGFDRSLEDGLNEVREAVAETRRESILALQDHQKLYTSERDAARSQTIMLSNALDDERKMRDASHNELEEQLCVVTLSQDGMAAKLVRDLEEQTRQLEEHTKSIRDLQAMSRQWVSNLGVGALPVVEEAPALSDAGVDSADTQSLMSLSETLTPGLESRFFALEKTMEDFRASTAASLLQHKKASNAEFTELHAKIAKQAAAFAEGISSERVERNREKQAKSEVQAVREAQAQAQVAAAMRSPTLGTRATVGTPNRTGETLGGCCASSRRPPTVEDEKVFRRISSNLEERGRERLLRAGLS